MSLSHDIYGRPLQQLNPQTLQLEKSKQIRELENSYNINILKNQVFAGVKADMISVIDFQINGRTIPLDMYIV
jgi:hypothetical protein